MAWENSENSDFPWKYHKYDGEDIESLVGGVNHKVECSTTNIAGAYITK